MPARTTIELETSHGPASARAVPIHDKASPDGWELSHPWGNLTFYGTTAEAKRELQRLVTLNEDEDET